MRKIIACFFIIPLLMVLICCASDSSKILDDDISVSNSNSHAESELILQKNYAFLEDDNLEFNGIMIENPIDKRMEIELKEINLGGIREAQMFYDGYVKIWQEELKFSIHNLEKYLTDEDKQNLEISQKNWEVACSTSNQFENSFKGHRGIDLGTQFVSNKLKYLIDQYKERVFYVKYLTYLAENYIQDPVPESEQTWSIFLIS